MFEIEYYQTENGQKPVEEFIDNLEILMQVKVLRQIGLLEQYGPRLGEKYSSRVSNGIFELRIQQSNNITRILYFFCIGRKIVLTNGFVKKTPKTPPGEIRIAEKYKRRYEERNDENE